MMKANAAIASAGTASGECFPVTYNTIGHAASTAIKAAIPIVLPRTFMPLF